MLELLNHNTEVSSLLLYLIILSSVMANALSSYWFRILQETKKDLLDKVSRHMNKADIESERAERYKNDLQEQIKRYKTLEEQVRKIIDSK